MNRFLTISAAAVVTLFIAAATAPDADAGEYLKDLGCKIACCPMCSHSCQTCTLEAEMVDVEKTCFDVECKTICIPRVVFPWQKKKCGSCRSCDGRGCSSCINNGARTRKVRVLKTKKYTCPECEYSWSPDEDGPCCGSCDRGCGDASCDRGCFDASCDSGRVFNVGEPVETYGTSYQAVGSEYTQTPGTQYGLSPAPVVIAPPIQ